MRTWSPRNQGTATQAAANTSMVGALRLVASTMRRHVLELLYRYAMLALLVLCAVARDTGACRGAAGGRLQVLAGGRSGGGGGDSRAAPQASEACSSHTWSCSRTQQRALEAVKLVWRAGGGRLP